MKITAVALVLAIVMVGANLFGSARTIPMPKEPVPGIEILIGTTMATTNSEGVGTIANVPPGPVIITFRRGHGVATGRGGGCFGMYVKWTGGGNDASGVWKDTTKEFKMNIVVEGRGPQKVTAKVTEGKCS